MSPLMMLPMRPIACPIVIPIAPMSSRLQNGICQRQAEIPTATAPPNMAPKKATPALPDGDHLGRWVPVKAGVVLDGVVESPADDAQHGGQQGEVHQLVA